MLWRIFVPKREEVAGGCRRLQNDELRNLYASPNVVGVMESGRMVRLTTYLHLVPGLRMPGAVPPLPTSSWRAV
jgi:hypothetical protein